MDKIAQAAEKVSDPTVESAEKVMDIAVKSLEKVVDIIIERSKDVSKGSPKDTVCQSLKLGNQLPGELSAVAEEMLGLGAMLGFGANVRSAKLAVAGDASKEASDFCKNAVSLKKKNQTVRVNPRAGCLPNFVG